MVNDIKTIQIIEKWYKRIGFEQHYDKEFYDALESIYVDTSVTIDEYNLKEEDGKKNFLYFLYFCEDLERRYKEKGIGEDILADTLSDIPRWLDTWSGLKGGMYLGELEWLSWHFRMKLFKLGRLQFNLVKAHNEIASKGIMIGDDVMGVHIPASGPLLKEECEKSFDMAREFFAKYFPDYKYEYFTCHSWLLDESLEEILGEESNILKFQKLFEIVDKAEADSIIPFVLRWKAQREDIADIKPKSGFAKKVKELAMNGRVFYVGSGVVKK